MTALPKPLTDPNLIADLFLQFCQRHPQYLSISANSDANDIRKHAIHRKRFAKTIAKSLQNEQFHFGNATLYDIKTAPDKTRTVHQFSVYDKFIMSLMNQACLPELTKQISPYVYSYLPGKSHWQAISHLCRYLSTHRDVYLLRTDITHYTDSIPICEDSPLWSILDDFLFPNKKDTNPYLQSLFKQALRPIITNDTPYQQWRGIPMGTPLTPIMANLYLLHLDHAIIHSGIQCYMRFGDDIILADTNPDALLHSNDTLSEQLAMRKLIRQPQKDQYYYLNRAGRKTSTIRPFIGSASFDYLGSRIHACGNAALTKEKMRKLLQDIYMRANRVHHAMENEPLNRKGPVICHAISNALTSHTLFCDYRDLLLIHSDYRGQLKQIDYLIARHIASLLTGIKGVKAFRKVGYRQLRQWGLVSVVQLRNKGITSHGL